MFTEWPTAKSNRTRSRNRTTLLRRGLAAALSLAVLAGCSLLPAEGEQERLPEIRVPKISQKPEYPVTRTTLEVTASGSGKLMSEREENLIFTEDNRRVTEVLVQAGDKVKKGQTLAKLDTGETESQIRRKEIELEKVELDLQESMRSASENTEIALRKQKLDYELLRQELEELRGKLQGSAILAPFDGTVVSFTAEVGDLSRAYEKAGQIADTDSLVVAVEFGSSDLENIAPGMEATVSINAAGDHKGTVRRLPAESASPGGEDSLATYVLIDLDEWPEGVSHGTPLTAAVTVERRENALAIPLAALRTQNSRNYVIVSNPDGSKGEVDVEVGVKTSTEAEIIKGLEEGRKVVGK